MTVDFESTFSRLADRTLSIKRGIPIATPTVRWAEVFARMPYQWMSFQQLAIFAKVNKAAAVSAEHLHTKKFDRRRNGAIAEIRLKAAKGRA